MTKQLSLLNESNVNYNHIHVKKSTFLGGITSPAHRWFRLTPSFGPELVDIMLSTMGTEKNHIVLDPFCGAGTTLIQTKLNGLESYGFEINPVLQFVCKVSINWDLSPDKLTETLENIKHIYTAENKKHANNDINDIGIPLPVIHNVFRWWREDVLKELLILKSAIVSSSEDSSVRDFFFLALAGVLIPDLTNVTLGRLQLHFIDRSKDEIDVWNTFMLHAKQMIEDVKAINNETKITPSSVFLTDSVNLTGVNIPKKVDRVVTSPPYPNRYSYVWNTRPYLYFFDFLDNAKQAADLDKKTIGGTWGSATSDLAKGIIEPKYTVIEEKVWPITQKIREQDNLMANYVMKYFNMLTQQIVVQDKLLTDNARCAYVVGCSRIKNVFIETDVMLGDIFAGLGLGYQVEQIERFRKRNSGKDLFESIVYVCKK